MTHAKKLIGALILWLSIAMPAQAQVTNVMNEYYTNSKNYVSSTSAGAYSTQTRHALTGGNYVWRAPQVTTPLANIQLPRIEAGCGGIDLYGGGFSFINGEQIEDLFRAILQDAAGYAFMLALEEISPIIAGNVKSLQDIIQKVNNANLNSCETAQVLVDNASDAISGKISNVCAVQGVAASIFPDAFAGRACGDENPGNVVAGAQKNDPDLNLPVNQNYAMKATENSSFKDDLELREFYMSLTGTLVVTVQDQPKYHYLPPVNLDESVVRTLMSGGTFIGHKCNPVTIGPNQYTASDCLDVEAFGKPIEIDPSDGFLVRVNNTLASIYDKASGASSAPMTDIEIAFINDTPLPLQRAAVILSMDQPEVGKSILLSYSELIAYAMTLKFMEKSSRAVLDASHSNASADQDTLEEWRKGINENIIELSRLQSRLEVRYTAVQAFIDQMEQAEERVTGTVNSQLLRTISSSRSGG